jgi:hypothetical protein
LKHQESGLPETSAADIPANIASLLAPCVSILKIISIVSQT